MKISPAVGSSSPAIIRNRVVLPQPDGPSSTRNSLSWMVSDTSSTARTGPNSFTMRWMRTSAMALPLGRAAAGEALPQIALDYHEDDEHARDGGGGGQSPVGVVLARNRCQPGRNRAGGVAG